MIKQVWKTREVANEIGVDPSTVQRWVKYFQLPYNVNKLGHYEMDEATYEKLKLIHSETKKGKRMKEIDLPGIVRSQQPPHPEKMVNVQQLEERIEKLMLQAEQFERQLQSKADEVVEYQVLTHRNEINDLVEVITQLSNRIKVLEDHLSQKDTRKQTIEIQPREPQVKKRRLASIFSL